VSRGRKRDPRALADVEIGAAARAKRLRFNRKPEVDVRFETGPDGESASVSERENLPEEVEPGVTYRDVRVRWAAGARIVTPDERVDEIEGSARERETRD
jgi:hypothetical protein